jgi:hypothetical protein
MSYKSEAGSAIAKTYNRNVNAITSSNLDPDVDSLSRVHVVSAHINAMVSNALSAKHLGEGLGAAVSWLLVRHINDWLPFVVCICEGRRDGKPIY